MESHLDLPKTSWNLICTYQRPPGISSAPTKDLLVCYLDEGLMNDPGNIEGILRNVGQVALLLVKGL
jgi:hypothetical protein